MKFCKDISLCLKDLQLEQGFQVRITVTFSIFHEDLIFMPDDISTLPFKKCSYASIKKRWHQLQLKFLCVNELL